MCRSGAAGTTGTVDDGTERDDWFIGGRWYLPTYVSAITGDEDGMTMEVEDVGPDLPRGLVVAIYYDDLTGDMTITTYTTDPLPVPLLDHVLRVARRALPPQHETG